MSKRDKCNISSKTDTYISLGILHIKKKKHFGLILKVRLLAKQVKLTKVREQMS